MRNFNQNALMNKLYFTVFFLCLSVLFSCKKKTLFEQISSSHSGVHFNNQITESDSVNALDMVNAYNGGGVGIGDFNGDGLQDLFFTGNMVPNRLYLNKGNFKFEDITDKAGVGGDGRWGRGVAIVDINNDGLPDIYICNTIYKDSTRRRNLLYICLLYTSQTSCAGPKHLSLNVTLIKILIIKLVMIKNLKAGFLIVLAIALFFGCKKEQGKNTTGSLPQTLTAASAVSYTHLSWQPEGQAHLLFK